MPTCEELGKHENLDMLVAQWSMLGKSSSREPCISLRLIFKKNLGVSAHFHESALFGIPNVSADLFERVWAPSSRRSYSTQRPVVIHDLHSWHFLRAKQADVETTSHNKLRRTFRQLAEHWRRDTRYVSLAKKKVLHPAYQRIIGLGPQALPLIFEELRQRPSQWFWALECITGEDPAKHSSTFKEAVEEWLAWARQNGYPDE